MNYEIARKKINKDYANALLAAQMKQEYGMTAGFRSVALHLARMRKRLLDWQEGYDCDNVLCTISKTQPVTVISYGSRTFPAGACVLNPPLMPCHPSFNREWAMNITDTIVNTFTR